MLTPEQVHYNLAGEITKGRAAVLAAAFEKNPNRFKNRLPVPETLPKEVWINPPTIKEVGV
jgi:hypothetical protein